MSRTFIFFLFSCFFVAGFGQVYQPVPTSNVMWRENATGYQCSCCSDYQLTVTGDTVINAMVYHKLKKTGIKYQEDVLGYCTNSIQNPINQYAGCFRNDTLNKKIYFVPPFATADTLLYDFSLAAGDTVLTYLSTPFGLDWVVTNIDSVNSGGVYRKRFELNNCLPYSLYIIEGIGSTYGFLSPFICPAPYYEYIYNLSCFSYNNITIYPDSSTACDVVSPVNDISANNKFSIFPNPANGHLYIETDLFSYTVNIINATGQIVLSEKNIAGNSMINIENLARGMYLLQIIVGEKMDYQIIIKQ